MHAGVSPLRVSPTVPPRSHIKSDACVILKELGIPRGGDSDFFALPSSKIEDLLSKAAHYGYRKSRNAPGSTARMFHKYLQRACRR